LTSLLNWGGAVRRKEEEEKNPRKDKIEMEKSETNVNYL